MINWNVTPADERAPLLEYLRRKLPLAPASYLRQLIRSGRVCVNSLVADEEYPVQPDDTVSLPESRKLAELIERCRHLPELLYESEMLLVVRKPAGLASHAGKGHEEDNLAARVGTLLAGRGDTFRSAPIHRLDRPTSGPVLFGKGQKAISELGKMMQEGTVTKRYLALVRSGLPPRGELLSAVPGKGKWKPASTCFSLIEQQAGLALLELQLGTGRQHQIRRQLADAGYPVAGDSRYRGPQYTGLDRLFLHCHSLSFTCPFSAQTITVEDPLPDDLSHFLAGHGFASPSLVPGKHR